jgi:hypothetical protein
MIEPNQSDVGRKVIFRFHGNAKVEGAITRLNNKYVFVRFDKKEGSAGASSTSRFASEIAASARANSGSVSCAMLP